MYVYIYIDTDIQTYLSICLYLYKTYDYTIPVEYYQEKMYISFNMSTGIPKPHKIVGHDPLITGYSPEGSRFLDPPNKARSQKVGTSLSSFSSIGNPSTNRPKSRFQLSGLHYNLDPKCRKIAFYRFWAIILPTLGGV